ncbi:MAG: hypothetical protein AAF458_14040 [Pseudomonadota bacterium]
MEKRRQPQPDSPARGEISLGDAVRALADLDLTDDDADMALATLGLARGAHDPNPTQRTFGAADKRARRKRKSRAERREKRKRGGAPQPPAPPIALPPEIIETTLARLPDREPDDNDSAPLARLPGQQKQSRESPVTLDAPRLFASRTERALLAAALATPRESEQADLSAVMDAVTRGEVLAALPRRLRPSLHQGVQLFLDLDPLMHPFRPDMHALIDAVQLLAGPSQCEIYEFEGDPGDAWPEGFRDYLWTPQAGRPVLLATALGASLPGTATAEAGAPSRAEILDRWDQFINRCRQAGSAVTALVPYPPARWPQRLSRRMQIVHWDRFTRAGEVRRLLRQRIQNR